jgi:Holliday junction DNA helicase RuvB
MLIGQQKVKKQIELITQNEFKPTLICGPSGYGKTTFASYISESMSQDITIINCATKTNKQDIIKDILRVPKYSCVLLDEIHSLPTSYQEIVYSFLDKQSIVFNKLKLDVSTINFIGATTDEGSLLEPLLNRFVYKLRLDNYTDEDLGEIVYTYLEHNYGKSDCYALGKTARGCPRVAIARANAYKISGNLSNFFEYWDVSPEGFEKPDFQYLELLKNNYPKPVSLKTIEQKLKMSADSVINNIESFLIHKNLILKSSKGRELTEQGLQFMNVDNIDSFLHHEF